MRLDSLGTAMVGSVSTVSLSLTASDKNIKYLRYSSSSTLEVGKAQRSIADIIAISQRFVNVTSEYFSGNREVDCRRLFFLS